MKFKTINRASWFLIGAQITSAIDCFADGTHGLAWLCTATVIVLIGNVFATDFGENHEPTTTS